MCNFILRLKQLLTKQKENIMSGQEAVSMFERVSWEITKTDEGGKAGRQLDITEARQALSNVLPIIKKLSMADFLELMATGG